MMALAQYDVCLSLSFAPYDIWSSCHLIYVYDIWLSRHMLNMMFVCHYHLLHMTFGHHANWSTYMIFGYQGICSKWCLFVIVICSIWDLVTMAFALYDIWISWHLLNMMFGCHSIGLYLIFGYHGIGLDMAFAQNEN